jgi:YHS domain-containing protein
MNPCRRQFFSGLAASFATSVTASSSSFALDPKSSAPVNLDPKGVALRGYDPVGYFTENRPVQGTNTFQSAWEGATYQFAHAANKAAFDAAPEKYAPKYGGFCAYAASQGYKADADPNAWTVVDGKLYVNYNASVAKEWASKKVSYIQAADKNWPKVQTLLPK